MFTGHYHPDDGYCGHGILCFDDHIWRGEVQRGYMHGFGMHKYPDGSDVLEEVSDGRVVAESQGSALYKKHIAYLWSQFLWL